MNNRKKEILIVSLFIIIQTVIFVIFGLNKSYIHMDEAYSMGLASYDKTEIQNNEDSYNTWHNGDYYEDYMSVHDDDGWEYAQVYENQKNDVHPPLYYLILRFAMGFSRNQFSMWPGLIINLIIFVFITIFMYLILQKLLENQKYVKVKSIILAFMSSLTIAAITNALYIRMYALTTLMILITTYLHLKLLDNEKVLAKLLIPIGIFATLGSLTHYYYLFFLGALYILFVIKYIKEKNIKNLLFYTLTMIVAAAISLLIFPYSINHMFFGYRGQGVISKLTDIENFFNLLHDYILKINFYGFNNMMFVSLITIAVLTLGIIIYRLVKKQKLIQNHNKYIIYIVIPLIVYFIIVAVASPWIELRYIMPIDGLAFAVVIYFLYTAIHNIFNEKISNIIITIFLLIIIVVTPIMYNIEPESLYSNKKEITEKLSTELNLPTIFFFNSNENRFLDDILLFSYLDESYIAKDVEPTEENISEIVEGKNLEKGIIIFINEGQNNDEILNNTMEILDFETIEHLQRLNACDVYYVH